MSGALRVISPGLLTTVQDLGRPGYQHLGIPVSGALDALSFSAANILVGNAPETAALEIACVGPTLAIEAEDARLSFVGGKAAIEILPDREASAGTLIGTMETVRLKRGEVVRIGAVVDATTLYVAVEGGFEIAPVMESRSTYLRGEIGGFKGRALAAGDRVPLVRDSASDRDDVRLEGLDLKPPGRLRVIIGPQDDYFSDSAIAAFFDSEYTVAGSDRMGMRLAGPQIAHARGYNITSDAIAPGSIQVPGNGRPIVLLADRQTTGGYPKIATVISADLPALGRLRAGAKIAFTPVTIEAAIEARQAMFSEIASLHGKLVPLSLDKVIDEARLSGSNLISGIVGGEDEAP